jgi:hypothetical protein
LEAIGNEMQFVVALFANGVKAEIDFLQGIDS